MEPILSPDSKTVLKPSFVQILEQAAAVLQGGSEGTLPRQGSPGLWACSGLLFLLRCRRLPAARGPGQPLRSALRTGREAPAPQAAVPSLTYSLGWRLREGTLFS